MRSIRFAGVPALVLFGALGAHAQTSFVNWETPHVSPLALTPDGKRLLAVNTADDRLEVFDLQFDPPWHLVSIPVGLDPVSVRARSATEAWVVNHVSDSISIVDLTSGRVRLTIDTADEPCDVVFAGPSGFAFVSCSQANLVQVFDAAAPGAPLAEIPIAGEDPRALAVSPDGQTVYAAIFESGNSSTILGGGAMNNLGFPPNVVSDPAGPYGGQNPPPNAGTGFQPPIDPTLPPPPAVGLIVKKDDQGRWMDDNGGDWTPFVSGAQAAKSGRPVGWDLLDHDVAVIDAQSFQVSYVDRLMNLDMALGVDPVTGRVLVVGTEGTNEIRFEPNLKGRFLRVLGAYFGAGSPTQVVDLNPHLDYQSSTLPQSERDKSIGDPRGVAWNPAGGKVYVTGMGSNNLVVFDKVGNRIGLHGTIEVGEGPTGVVFDALRNRLYVLNKFAATISIVDAALEIEVQRLELFDPTPAAIKTGRKHLYDTHKNSGLGQIACASCHVDARTDRLAWDLGDPQGSMKSVQGQNLGANVPGLNTGFQDWHPMKGPMLTQTLQDIIGKEPFHWRGDRDGLEEFSGAFQSLQGDDQSPTPAEMQEFEDFLATVHFPPNPFRNVDNSLPTSLDLPFGSPGRFSPKGTPLPPGDATRGLQLYRPPNLLDAGGIACSSCHTLPIGIGTDTTLTFGGFQPIPPGPNGEHHHMLVSVDGSTNVTMKVPQLRNLFERVGFDTGTTLNTQGFGYLHDGSVDTLAQFVAEPVFQVQSDQDIADLCAFLLAFSGSDLPYGGSLLEPPATQSLDTHAAVGLQTTIVDGQNPPPSQLNRVSTMLALADSGAVGLVVKGILSGESRGFHYLGLGTWQSDRAAQTILTDPLLSSAQPGAELTVTVVPKGTEVRIGVDRDEDGVFDRDEIDQGSDPADPTSVPGCGSVLRYGSPELGSSGQLAKIATKGGPPQVGNASFSIAVTGGSPNSFAVLVAGDQPAALVKPWGTLLVTGPHFTRTLTMTDATGSAVVGVAVTPAMAGTTRFFQFVLRDPGFGGNVQASDGLAVTFCP